jgi:DNA-binding NarL/FixJ family response regulator
MAVAGEAEDGEEAWRKVRALVEAGTPPDVVVMDVSMPGWNGVEATAKIRGAWATVRVLALSMHEDKSYLRSLLEAGASGYVLKRSAGEELIRALRAVAAGGTYLDPSLSAAVMETLVGGGRGGAVPSAPLGGGATLRGEIAGAPLSERESTVLRFIAEGHSNKEIAAKLGVSVKTVETYKARSMEKLGLDGRADIVRYALAQGWLRS